MLASAGSEVDNPICGLHHGFIVFDNQDGIAQIPQVLESFNESSPVNRVEPHRGFVTNIEHTHQPTPDLGSQPNACRLAPGKRSCRPIQSEIVEAHIHQESKP